MEIPLSTKPLNVTANDLAFYYPKIAKAVGHNRALFPFPVLTTKEIKDNPRLMEPLTQATKDLAARILNGTISCGTPSHHRAQKLLEGFAHWLEGSAFKYVQGGKFENVAPHITDDAKQKKYTFISTGMSDYKMIDKAVEIFKSEKCEFELMHCISAYPFENKYAQLMLINALKERYHCKVGYSGHEKSGLAISYAACALGISSLERHFTTDRTLYGSDQAASLTPEGFSRLVGGIRAIEEAMSDRTNNKIIIDIEKPVAEKLREHIKNNYFKDN